MSRQGLGRVAAYGLVLLLAVLLAVWGAFLVPLRVGAVPVPLGLVLALTPVPLEYAGGRLLGTRVGAAAPWLVWVLTALLLAAPRREGDVVVASGLRGLAFLAIGLLSGAAAVGAGRPTGRDRDTER